MGLFDWLTGNNNPVEEWKPLTDADVKEAEDLRNFWGKQKRLALRYVGAKGQAMEDEAIAKGSFAFLDVAQKRAKAIQSEISGIAKAEQQQALPSAKRRVNAYRKELRKHAGER